MAKERTLHRSIDERWVVIGTLVLETPAHFGNGDADALTDMPLLMDEASQKPLLTGASLAGALRNYLRERSLGFGVPEDKNTPAYWAALLLGGFRGDDEGSQSPLIVFDSVGEPAGVELRDGVAIDPDTRTAVDEKKFDLQLLSAGTSFPLRFELAVSGDGTKVRQALAVALNGLKSGEITLGARKRRGFGKVKVENWQVWKYDLHTKAGLLAWLKSNVTTPGDAGKQAGGNLDSLASDLDIEDIRQKAHLSATFTVDGTLMIRSGFGESDKGPDMVHLHSPRGSKGTPVPIIPGTSWAGVLRGRAEKIARPVSGDNQKLARTFVDRLFGPSEIKPGQKDVRASRVSIKESEIEHVDSLVVTRVKIDRFTGGAFESALFTEQPAVGKLETRVTLDLTLRRKAKPTNEKKAEQEEKEFQAEIGLLLLLLKDLWTGDLPIGGESGVGRGRLKGVKASLKTPEGEWTFEQNSDQLVVTPDAKTLETWVDEFNQAMKKAQVEA